MGEAQYVVAAAGGGSIAAADLLGQGGMSGKCRSFHLINERTEFAEYIGGTPDSYASLEAAQYLATASFFRAGGGSAYGVGIAAALASPGERQGRSHRAFIALQDNFGSWWAELDLSGSPSRGEQERLISHGLQFTLSERFDCQAPLVANHLDIFHCSNHQAVFLGEHPFSRTSPSGIVLPTAANPLHEGHRAMAHYAHRKFGVPVDIEITIRNAAKPRLGTAQIEGRWRHATSWIEGDGAFGEVYLSNLPTFAEKAEASPRTTFLIGVDTFNRIGTHDWTEEVTFLVFPRLDRGGVEIRPNRPFAYPFSGVEGVEPSRFSSTEARERAGLGQGVAR